MRNSKTTFLALALGLVLIGTILFAASPEAEPASGVVLFTEVPVAVPDSAWLFPEGSRIAALDPTSSDPKVLTEGFAAARAPSVSFDGHTMIFAGQKAQGGPWQIWEMPLAGGEARLVTPDCKRCTNPMYLPDGRIAYSAPAVDSPERLVIYVAKADGSEAHPITFDPSPDEATWLMQDGRVLYRSYKYDRGVHQLYAVRYDGTIGELIYENPAGVSVSGPVRGGTDGALYFAEASGRLVRIEEFRSHGSRRELMAEGFFQSATPVAPGKLVAAYRKSVEEAYRLVAFDEATRRVTEALATVVGFHALEPVVARSTARPVGFVSMVDPAMKSGIFFSTNAHITGLSVDSSRMGQVTAMRISTPQKVLGQVRLEPDGSFHVEVPADTPLRFESVDGSGRVIGKPSAWVWIRPGEMRGCVGCHENRELAPENTVPMAITKPAVSFVPKTEAVAAGQGGNDLH